MRALVALLAVGGAGCWLWGINEPWARHNVPGSNVTVELPGRPAFAPDEMKRQCGVGHGQKFRVETDRRLFRGSVIAFPPSCSEFLAGYLDQIRNLKGDDEMEVTERRAVTVDSISGMEFSFNPAPKSGSTRGGQVMRVFTTDALWISLEVLSNKGEEGDPRVDRFLDSLRVGPSATGDASTDPQ